MTSPEEKRQPGEEVLSSQERVTKGLEQGEIPPREAWDHFKKFFAKYSEDHKPTEEELLAFLKEMEGLKPCEKK